MDYMGGSAPDQITIVSSSIWNLSALSDEFNSLDIYIKTIPLNQILCL